MCCRLLCYYRVGFPRRKDWELKGQYLNGRLIEQKSGLFNLWSLPIARISTQIPDKAIKDPISWDKARLENSLRHQRTTLSNIPPDLAAGSRKELPEITPGSNLETHRGGHRYVSVCHSSRPSCQNLAPNKLSVSQSIVRYRNYIW